MTIFNFDKERKLIQIVPSIYTIATATTGTGIVIVNETIQSDTPSEGLLNLGVLGMMVGGYQDLSSGYDFASNPAYLVVTTVDGQDTLLLNTNCSNLADIVSMLNTAFESGGLYNHSRTIEAKAGDGSPVPTNNLVLATKSGFEGEDFGIVISRYDGDCACDELGLSIGLYIGQSHEYSFTSWTGSTFTLDSNLTETYTVGYGIIALDRKVSCLDMYSAAMTWSDELANFGVPIPMSAEGNVAIGEEQFTDSIFKLQYDWTVQPAGGIYNVSFIGTIVQDSLAGGTGTETEIITPAYIGSVNTELKVSTHGVVFDPLSADSIAAAVWDDPMADHDTIATMGRAVNIAYRVNTGRWKINTALNTMTFYDTDGVSVLLVFDLKDSGGLPSSTNVFERDPA